MWVVPPRPPLLSGVPPGTPARGSHRTSNEEWKSGSTSARGRPMNWVEVQEPMTFSYCHICKAEVVDFGGTCKQGHSFALSPSKPTPPPPPPPPTGPTPPPPPP